MEIKPKKYEGQRAAAHELNLGQCLTLGEKLDARSPTLPKSPFDGEIGLLHFAGTRGEARHYEKWRKRRSGKGRRSRQMGMVGETRRGETMREGITLRRTPWGGVQSRRSQKVGSRNGGKRTACRERELLTGAVRGPGLGLKTA